MPALPDFLSLEAPAGLQAFDANFNALIDLLNDYLVISYEEVELTMNGATETAAGLFPANVFRLGASWRVTEAITGTGGIASFKTGDGSDDDLYGTGTLIALNSFGGNAPTADPTGWFNTAGDVVLTPNAGAFSTGKVKVRAYFAYLRPPAAV